MAQLVYLFTADGGDGSNSVSFTRDPDLLDRLIEDDPDTYGMNEGYSDVLTFPDELDLEACGFSFYEE